jgi:hypothetical protein
MSIRLTYQEALQAIAARIQGVFDDPALIKAGALSTDKTADILYIISLPKPILLWTAKHVTR